MIPRQYRLKTFSPGTGGVTVPQRRDMTWSRFLKDEQEFSDINIRGGKKEKDTPRQREQYVHDEALFPF